jgi:hypothetical protein
MATSPEETHLQHIAARQETPHCDATNIKETVVHANAKAPGQAQTITPEPRLDHIIMTGQTNTPSTPGCLLAFDWDDFEARYLKALADADAQEHQVLSDFNRLVAYFNSWASASTAHDNDRAVKRLQTRQRFVTLSEESVAQKQQHYNEVFQAFQSALALLSSAQ